MVFKSKKSRERHFQAEWNHVVPIIKSKVEIVIIYRISCIFKLESNMSSLKYCKQLKENFSIPFEFNVFEWEDFMLFLSAATQFKKLHKIKE